MIAKRRELNLVFIFTCKVVDAEVLIVVRIINNELGVGVVHHQEQLILDGHLPGGIVEEDMPRRFICEDTILAEEVGHGVPVPQLALGFNLLPFRSDVLWSPFRACPKELVLWWSIDDLEFACAIIPLMNHDGTWSHSFTLGADHVGRLRFLKSLRHHATLGT